MAPRNFVKVHQKTREIVHFMCMKKYTQYAYYISQMFSYRKEIIHKQKSQHEEKEKKRVEMLHEYNKKMKRKNIYFFK